MSELWLWPVAVVVFWFGWGLADRLNEVPRRTSREQESDGWRRKESDGSEKAS